MAGISNLNLKLAGSHAGVSIGEDGPSQMALEDLAMMRAVPNCAVLYPCDGVSAERLVAAAGRCEEVFGGRLTGAGFGGACVFLIERGSEELVRVRLIEGFREAFDRDPEVAVFQAAGGPIELEL